jgi:hypothetical protein
MGALREYGLTRDEADAAAMGDGFGTPRLHSGLSIRKLARHLYECRTGVDLRLVFEAQKGTLTFDFAGSHDDVGGLFKRPPLATGGRAGGGSDTHSESGYEPSTLT